MIRSVVVEDDPFHMELFLDLIGNSFPHVKIIGQAKNAAEGISVIRNQNPDLVFLDLELPDYPGFHILNELEGLDFEVVFLTAHEKFALKAHDYDHSGYLIKPISKESLDDVLNKLISKRKENQLNVILKDWRNSVQSALEFPKKIAIPSLKEIHFINLKEIIRLEADGNYTTFFFQNGKTLTSSRQIGEFESRLSGQGFFRIHDKHLVNLCYVSVFMKGEAGSVILEDKTQLPVSRRRKEEFLNKINDVFC